MTPRHVAGAAAACRARRSRVGPPTQAPAPRDRHNAILFQARTGCSWRQLPGDLPPWTTVYDYFAAWSGDGTVDRVHDRLRAAVRDADSRDPMASGGCVDSQSVNGADTVGAGSRGSDAGKKIDGRKRHVPVGSTGLLLVVLGQRRLGAGPRR
jgi:transposase